MYESFAVREAKKILESHEMIIAYQPEIMSGRKQTEICNKLANGGFSAVFYPLEFLRSLLI